MASHRASAATSLSRRRLGQAAIASALASVTGCSKEPDINRVLKLAEAAAGVRIGATDKPLAGRVFFDPVCAVCARLWESCKPLSPHMGIIWHPVGTSEQTVPLAAGRLEQQDVGAAFEEIHAMAQAGVPWQYAWLEKAKQQAGERWAGKVEAVRKTSNRLLELGVEGVPLIIRVGTDRLPPAMRIGTAPPEYVAEFLGRPLPSVGDAGGAGPKSSSPASGTTA